ncbi:hypothetical protein H0H92_004271 [Tricholoma furcatifolium]|nr:hypothetical protein H0H92_004271 [Tricholoma furcatifolium]
MFIDGGVLPIPLVLGHEISGHVVEIGENVDSSIQRGKLYAVLSITPSAKSHHGLPALFDSPGASYDGGFAEYVLVRHDQLVPVPDGVSAEFAAVAADAGINAFKFVVRAAGIDGKRSSSVLILGVGGLGHQAVSIAAHFNSTVYACDSKPEARALALKLGAKEVFSPDELAAKIAEGFTVDVAIDFVAKAPTFETCKSVLRGNNKAFPANPRLVVAGLTNDKLEFSTLDTLTYNLTIVTPQYGSKQDLQAILELYSTGKCEPVVSSHKLTEINDVLDRLRSGSVLGRIVVVP